MCKFCETLSDETKKIIWSVRSRYADDNTCEFIGDNNCNKCGGCKMNFMLSGYKINDNLHVSIEYNQILNKNQPNELIIRPFSEGVQFNFCPICGKQISKNIIENYHPFDMLVE